MQTNVRIPASVSDISAYLHSAAQPSQQAILGSVVTEIISSGRSLNRKAICSKLIAVYSMSPARKKNSTIMR